MNSPRRAAAIGLLCLAPLCATPGQVPEQINYQGRLVDGGGLVNGPEAVVFKLFNTPLGGVPLYVETQTVTVVDGLYAAAIGASNSAPGALSAVFTNAEVYLEVKVGSATFSPRERLVSVSYALVAGGLPEGAVTGSMVASNTFWATGGNAGTTVGTHFLGTTDNQALELRAGGKRGLRLEPDSSTNDAPNVIGGAAVNNVAAGVIGATIGGGGGSADPNTVMAPYATIGGEEEVLLNRTRTRPLLAAGSRTRSCPGRPNPSWRGE